MCAEHERIERIVANEVDDCEKVKIITVEYNCCWSIADQPPIKIQAESPNGLPARLVPSERHMVKRFNRSSAGKEEELPSDVRPPLILQVLPETPFKGESL